MVDGELLLGMMWQSRKALDLLRDGRLTLVTPRSDRHGADGDLKLYGTAKPVEDRRLRDAYGDATEARIGWRPAGSFHLFAVDIGSAGFISFGTDRRLLRWSAEGGLETLTHPDPAAGG